MGTLRVFAAVVFSAMLRTLHSQVSMPISGVVQYVLPWNKRHVQCCLLQAVALQWCLLQAFLSRHQLFHADLFLKLVGTLRFFLSNVLVLRCCVRCIPKFQCRLRVSFILYCRGPGGMCGSAFATPFCLGINYGSTQAFSLPNYSCPTASGGRCPKIDLYVCIVST